MALFRRKTSQKLTASEKQRVARLRRQAQKASTQNTIWYTSLFENGLMHVTEETYSKTFYLGDANYVTAHEEDKIDIIDSLAEAMNALDSSNHYQLLIINRRLDNSLVDNILYDLQDDRFDDYRKEYNEVIQKRFADDQNNFKVDKYITVSTQAPDAKQAMRQLNDIGIAMESQFNEADIALTGLSGPERLKIFSTILKNDPYQEVNYRDIALSGLQTKDFIAPGLIQFTEHTTKINHRFYKALYIRQYPSFLGDKLIKNLTDTGIEVMIAINASPYEPSEILKAIRNTDTSVKAEMVRGQRTGAMNGISEDLAVSGLARETKEASERWLEEIQDHDQKIYSGTISVFYGADSLEELAAYTDRIQTVARRQNLDFEEIFYYQEEALNSILPIGKNYLDVKKIFLRDMTTSNLATQVPFTNVDLQSTSSRAIYYGQNQLSNNMITLDRKKDLNTGSGVVLGSSGSGKSVTVKGAEIIPTILKYPEDRVIIVDPEDEYSDIGKEFGAQLIDVFPGSRTHLNLMDLPDADKLDDEDLDPVGQKSNLLMGLFESILTDVSDSEFSIIDRVTRETYASITDRTPTLKDWQAILRRQPEAEAKALALKSESYTSGSQDIFAYETNIDLEGRFVIFNLKKLNGKLKPFALMVIQDYIWNQVVNGQGKRTTRIYFDEMQLMFKNDYQAQFFTELYSRVRKYGAIPTGITQNVETLIAREEGRKLLSNSEFMVLLKQKKTDLEVLARIVNLTDQQIQYVAKPKEKGTGLIVAGGVVVPFENPIPKGTKLYQLIATDA